ncbi:MAG: DUF882 domain-containing protein [Candidatus Thiodiazotropha sp.]
MAHSLSDIPEARLITRRQFITGLASAAGLLITSPVLAAIAPSQERTLAFHHTHTGERRHITYWRDGDYVPEKLQELNHLLRDFRTGDQVAIDRKLLDTLYALHLSLDQPGEFQIISAYRSPKTNAMLRKSSSGVVSAYRSPQTNSMLRKSSSGVAKRSLHMQGKAIDIRVCGCNLKQLRKTAMALKAGGVGYYPKSNFIHVDTGRVRYW